MKQPQQVGTPVKETNWPRLHAWTSPGGEKSLLATLGQNNGGLFVIDIDLATGHCRQFGTGLPGADYPTAAWRSPWSGILYIGSAYPGHLHRYDRQGAGVLEDLGPIDPDLARFPTGIAEAPDGSLYIGAWQKASLTRFDPRDDTFRRFGSLDPVDHYLYPCIGDDGTAVALVAVCRPHLVAFDPETGRATEIGPPELSDLAGPECPLFRGTDGMVYLEDKGSVFRIEGANLVPTETAPPRHPVAVKGQGPSARFNDGTIAELHHRPTATNRRLVLTPPPGRGSPRELELDWTGGGTDLYRLHAGPDGCVYGSSLLPEHLFRFRPSTEELVNLGQCSVSLGEAYSFANHGEDIYLASYPKARLSVFKPGRPVAFGTDPGSNPRDLGRPEDNSLRPYALAIGPDGSVWMGSAPDYGKTGGTLVSHHPTSGIFRSHGNLVPGCSPVSLCPLGERKELLIGWSIEPGTGARPVSASGALSLFDPVSFESTVIHLPEHPGLPDVNSLLRGADGLVYGILSRRQFDGESPDTAIAPELFVFDPQQRRIITREALPAELGVDLFNCLFQDDSGAIWGLFSRSVFSIESGSCAINPVWTTPEDFITACGAVIGGKAYFAAGPELYSIELS